MLELSSGWAGSNRTRAFGSLSQMSFLTSPSSNSTHHLGREFIDYKTSMITDENLLRGLLFY